MKARTFRYLLLGVPAASALLAVLLLFANASLLQNGGQRRANAIVDEHAIVNSIVNSSDGDCEGAPNDTIIAGECTLREAIEAVNSGEADSIGFLPRVFSIASGGVINIEDGAGCLPAIARSGIVIDLVGVRVIIDGDVSTDGTRAACQAGLLITLPHNGFDFTLLGRENLTIRDLDGDGVALDCGSFLGPNALRSISITGVHSDNISGVTVVDTCPTPTPTPTNTPSPTHTPTLTGTATTTFTPTITSTPTLSPTITSTPTITNTPTITSTPTRTTIPTNTRTPTNTATLTRTPVSTPTPHPGVKGDANCDGVLSSVDAVIILQYHSGLLAAFPCDANADIDHDGRITSLDASIILQMVAELL